MDIYQYPLPTNFYDNDSQLILFDASFVNSKISELTKKGITNSNTIYVYRYQKLIDRKLHLQDPFNKIIKTNHIVTEPIAIGANAANINKNLLEHLP